jgi:hypothetical protein
MKTKLLKKVRQRYVIQHIISVNDKVGDMKELFDYYKQPFYILIDRESRLFPFVDSSRDYDELYDKLVKTICRHYANTRKRNTRNKIVDVWY